jgi:chemotaxis signal transduction protein
MTGNADHADAPFDAAIAESAIQRLLDRPLSPSDLAAGAEWAARDADVRDRQTLGLLLFKVNDETAAVPAGLLRRVTPWSRPTPVPHRATGLLRGICNIRGELVLCADLRRVLRLAPRTDAPEQGGGAGDPRRMVVIGPADAPWVFEVDSLVGFERIAAASIKPPPVTVEYSLGAFTSGIAVVRSDRVTVLDGERLLTGFKAGLA